MKVKSANLDELNAKAELEFHDDAGARVAEMNRLLDQIAGDGPQKELLSDFQGHAHNLRITGASFGFPAVTLIAQRLENYLSDLSQWAERSSQDLQEFVDRIGEMLERANQPPDDEIATLVRALPSHVNREFHPGEVEIRHVEMLLVTPARAIAKLLSKQIMACGFRVNAVQDPVEGLTTAMRLRPDMLITSQVMKGLNGVDLIRALKAMEGTEKIPCAVLTSQELDAAVFARLPGDCAVLRTGEPFADDFAKAVTRFGLG